MVAFRATLEELESADILLHVIDISNPRYEEQIESVENILSDLNLHHIPTIRVLNKQDLVPFKFINQALRSLGGISLSAKQPTSLTPLINKMEAMITS